MAMKKYNEYLQVNPSFESVVDIAADSRNKNLWREYIVGDDMEKLMDFLCQTLGYETPDARRSLWVHGSYGTGKSYAAIFVKHLLEEMCIRDRHIQSQFHFHTLGMNRLVSLIGRNYM